MPFYVVGAWGRACLQSSCNITPKFRIFEERENTMNSIEYSKMNKELQRDIFSVYKQKRDNDGKHEIPAIVKELAERHNYNVKFEAEKGNGEQLFSLSEKVHYGPTGLPPWCRYYNGKAVIWRGFLLEWIKLPTPLS